MPADVRIVVTRRGRFSWGVRITLMGGLIEGPLYLRLTRRSAEWTGRHLYRREMRRARYETSFEVPVTTE